MILTQNLDIEEWWPNGYGAQRLYKLYAFFTSADGRSMSGKKLTIGFKTVELVQEFVSGDPNQGVKTRLRYCKHEFSKLITTGRKRYCECQCLLIIREIVLLVLMISYNYCWFH